MIVCEYVLINSTALIRSIENTIQIPPGSTLVTADVTSLYTNIDLAQLYLYIGQRLDPTKQYLVEILRMICEYNYFEYNSQIYHQFHGIAMGTNCAVSCANIYMNQFDQEFAPGCFFYRRYIDDVFFIWSGSEQDLIQLQNDMKNFLPRINLSFSTSPSVIPFLDLIIHLDPSNHSIFFTTFQKPINRYGYLPPFSHHPTHVLKGYIKGELVRYLRSSTKQADFDHMKMLLWSRLIKRGCRAHFLSNIFFSIVFSSRQERLNNRVLQPTKILPLVIPFQRDHISSALIKEVFLINQMTMKLLPKVRLLTALTTPPNITQIVCRSRLTNNRKTYLEERGNEDDE